MLYSITLLLFSNFFMTFAWYGHLKHREMPLWRAILISWGVAFFEYCLQVPANRYGAQYFTPTQLKIIQEVLTLVVFGFFSVWYLGEQFKWNYAISFLFILGAVFFAFKD
jgi:uncharacterized protein (DUF486 family)